MFGQHSKLEREDTAASALAWFLECAGRSCTWRRVEPDPPDFAFDVDGELWAVEETTLPLLLVSSGRSFERLTAQQPLDKKLRTLCEEIMREQEQPPGQGYIIMPFATALDLRKKREYEAFKA
jgi:hypothetical protein